MTDELHQAILATVRKVVVNDLRPLIPNMEKEDRWPESIFPKLGELGLLGLSVPEEFGGCPVSPLTQAHVSKELSKSSMAISLSVGAHANLCISNLYRNGNERQRRKYLPDLCAGRKVGGLAITEPDHGSDAVGMKTRAQRVDGGYLLNGTKMFITNAPIADLLIVYAKTDLNAGSRGLSTFLVEKEMEGFTVSRNIKKMGCTGSPTGEVVLHNCFVPMESRLGEEGEGIDHLMSGLDFERLYFAAGMLGTMERALELTCRYATERTQFGQPIAHYQLIQDKIAQMYTLLRASEALVFEAFRTWESAQSEKGVARGGKGTAIHRDAAAAIYFAADSAAKVVDHAVQVHGGYGYTEEFEVARLYRDCKLGEIGAGTQEIRKLIIAKEVVTAAQL